MTMTPAAATVKLEKMQSPQGRQRGVCVAPKHHLRAFLNPHTPKTRRGKTAGQIVLNRESRDASFIMTTAADGELLPETNYWQRLGQDRPRGGEFPLNAPRHPCALSAEIRR